MGSTMGTGNVYDDDVETLQFADESEDDYDEDESEDWQEGECDNCYGETVDGPLGPIYCACAIGQGADPEDCRCGPPADGSA